MTTPAVRYPRGFTTLSPVEGSPDYIKEGETTINELYTIYLSGRVNHQSWKFRRLVIQRAVAIFGNWAEWLQAQQKNAYLYGYNYDFLMDTLRFIETGRRTFSVQTWESLLLDNHPPTTDYRARKPLVHNQPPFTQVGYNISSVLSKWCSHPNGIEDLLKTLVIMFGKPHDVTRDT